MTQSMYIKILTIRRKCWKNHRSTNFDLSSSKKINESSKIEYRNALKISGCKGRLVYENSSVNENDKNKKKKRKCNIVWHNPPYSANVKDKY